MNLSKRIGKGMHEEYLVLCTCLRGPRIKSLIFEEQIPWLNLLSTKMMAKHASMRKRLKRLCEVAVVNVEWLWIGFVQEAKEDFGVQPQI